MTFLRIIILSVNTFVTINYVYIKLCELLNRPTLSQFFPTFYMDILEKISRHHWKEHLKINETATFESDASEDIAQQSCENLQTFVWWEGVGQFVPPTHHTKVCKMSRLQGTISS